MDSVSREEAVVEKIVSVKVSKFTPDPKLKLSSGSSGIYVIICEKKKYAYIGQSKNIGSRLRAHKMCILGNDKHPITPYIKMKEHLDEHGIESFQFLIHELCPEKDRLPKEAEAMIYYLELGYTLYNKVIAVGNSNNNIYCKDEFHPIIKDIIVKLSNPEFKESLQSFLNSTNQPK